MTTDRWLGLAAAAFLISFIVFAFRQGLKVRPSGRNTRDGVDDAVSLMQDTPPDPR